MTKDQTPYDEDDESYVSKSSIKKDMLRFQELGQTLLALPDKKLATVPLGDTLRDELKLAARMPTNNARRRQLQRIGKLIRNEDYTAIEESLAQQHYRDEKRQAEKEALKQDAETWVKRLLSGDKQSLADFIEQHQDADRQRLGQLLRNSKKEQEKEPTENGEEPVFKRGKNSLKLLDTVRQLLAGQ